MDKAKVEALAADWRPRCEAREYADFMMGLHQMAAMVAAEVDTRRDTMAGGQVTLTLQFYLGTGGAAERKARVDEISQGNGEWHNGYYRARIDCSCNGDGYSTFIELQFDPPIFAADLEADAA